MKMILNNESIKIIRNYNDANLLLDRGHKIVQVDRDRRDRKYMIFIFEKNEQLLKDLEEITPKK